MAALLPGAQISVLVVCDAAGLPMGTITETLIVRRLCLGQADFFTTHAADVAMRGIKKLRALLAADNHEEKLLRNYVLGIGCQR